MLGKHLPPCSDIDLSLIRRLIGPLMVDIVGIPGMALPIDIPGIPGMLGRGGMGELPADGGICPPGDLTAETRADIDTGGICDTANDAGVWFSSPDDKFNFCILEGAWNSLFDVRIFFKI